MKIIHQISQHYNNKAGLYYLVITYSNSNDVQVKTYDKNKIYLKSRIYTKNEIHYMG